MIRWAPPMSMLLLVGIAIPGVVCGLLKHGRSNLGLPFWFLAAWLCGLSVMTPTYYPYPRLMLPWLLAVFMGVGTTSQLWLDRPRRSPNPSHSESHSWMPSSRVGFILLVLLACSSVRSIAGTAHVWKDRTGIQSAAVRFSEQVREITRKAGFPEDEAMIYVCGEPTVVFHLRASGLPLVSPVPNLRFLGQPRPRPTFVVMTSRAMRSQENLRPWFEHGALADLLEPRAVTESDLVRLDESANLDDLLKRPVRPTEFWWWHVRP